ncbi:hypothetical protein B296_00054007 [Ensete ventricosum]|uniref:Uncharacterized protein n=1 Tax=Ensete ventricosum TaxID=4639 RepID=A0A426X520_ENSVE|nr:hypothetical protein B296_00054007 [Ensete ventricosum]
MSSRVRSFANEELELSIDRYKMAGVEVFIPEGRREAVLRLRAVPLADLHVLRRSLPSSVLRIPFDETTDWQYGPVPGRQRYARHHQVLSRATCDMISRESHVRNEEGYIPNHLVSFRMGKAAPIPGLLLPHHRYLFLDQAPEMKPKAYFFSPFVVL